MSQLQHAAFIGARRNDVIRLVALLSLLFALGCRAGAEQDTTDHTAPLAGHGPHPVNVELITEHASVPPGGQTRVGVFFDIEPGWHIYAKEPGDAGLPTKVIWTSLLPNDATLTQFEWPPAQELIDPGNIHTFGYSGTLVLVATLSTAPGIAVRDIPITAHTEWLACRELCLPGKADLRLTLPVSLNPPVLSTHAELFEQTAASP